VSKLTPPWSLPARLRSLPPLLGNAEERCEMCGVLFVTGHFHVIDLNSGRRLCTCEDCTPLFVRSTLAAAY
jgi:hypothetical protein